MLVLLRVFMEMNGGLLVLWPLLKWMRLGFFATRSRKHVKELVDVTFSIFVLHALLSEGQLQLPSCNGRTEARRLVDILWQRLG